MFLSSSRQKDQLVMISPLYTTLWDLSLNYNKPNQQSIVYPLQKDSKLSESESIKSLYYESSVESNVQELLKNNHVDIQLIDVFFSTNQPSLVSFSLS